MDAHHLARHMMMVMKFEMCRGAVDSTHASISVVTGLFHNPHLSVRPYIPLAVRASSSQTVVCMIMLEYWSRICWVQKAGYKQVTEKSKHSALCSLWTTSCRTAEVETNYTLKKNIDTSLWQPWRLRVLETDIDRREMLNELTVALKMATAKGTWTHWTL